MGTVSISPFKPTAFLKTLATGMCLAAGLVLAIPLQALALSCMPPDTAASYQFWKQSDTTFTLARGTLTPLEPLPKKRRNSVEEQHIQSLKPIRYRFEGAFIGKRTNHPASTVVTVEPACWAVWCGGYPDGSAEAIYAFETKSGTYRFVPNACNGTELRGDVNRHQAIIRKCMNGGPCKPRSVR